MKDVIEQLRWILDRPETTEEHRQEAMKLLLTALEREVTGGSDNITLLVECMEETNRKIDQLWSNIFNMTTKSDYTPADKLVSSVDQLGKEE